MWKTEGTQRNKGILTTNQSDLQTPVSKIKRSVVLLHHWQWYYLGGISIWDLCGSSTDCLIRFFLKFYLDWLLTSTAFLWRVKPSARYQGHGAIARGCGFQARLWAKKDGGASWHVDIGLEPGLRVSSSYVKLTAEEKNP